MASQRLTVLLLSVATIYLLDGKCTTLAVESELSTQKKTENEAVVVSYQELRCDYTYNKVFEEGFGGHFRKLGNGTVACFFKDDGTNKLACMALMKNVNASDGSGNFTTKLQIEAQGCWVKSAIDDTQCSTQDTCVDMQWKNGDPDRLGFCCCVNNNCNSRDTIQYLPYSEEENDYDDYVGKAEQSSNTTVIKISITLGALLLGSVAGVIIYYLYRKRKQAVAREQRVKMAQYNHEMRMHAEETPVVNFNDLALDVCLHRGRFGDVYRGKLNDKEVCVKYFHAQQRSLFLTEKEIYGVVDSNVKTIVECLACDEHTQPDGTIQYIVIMEYLSLGSLAMYLKTHTLSWREFCAMAQTAAAGIGYLHGETLINGYHKHAIVHRDINSRNILVRADMTCVIADMGFSMKIRGSKVIRNGVEEHAEDGSLRDVGTVRYMAPEILDCAVNLRDCESSLKQIDMYAFSLVLWELITMCRDVLYETKRYLLPFEEELGSHPGFEAMRLHVAKEHHRPAFPVNMKRNDATRLLRETVEECWDTDAEARLSALCVEERFKDIDVLMEHKGVPTLSKNETCYEKRKRLSSSSADIICRDYPELSPLLETDTPASESNGTTITNLDTPEHTKPDVNVDMDRDRLLGPTRGRNILAERNTLQPMDEVGLAVHENTLIPVHEAKVRQAAEEERVRRRQWEEQQQTHQPSANDSGRASRPAARNVQLDVHNEVRNQPPRVKENNLNVRRHNSQRNLNESSTSSNGGAGMILTIPDNSGKPDRPKSLNLNLNIKPEIS